MQGQAHLGMARLFHRQGHLAQAMEEADQALAIFQLCEAKGFIELTGELKYKIEQAVS